MGDEIDSGPVRGPGGGAFDLGGTTGPDLNHDPITRWLAAASVVLLALILAWALIATARGPSIHEHLDRIEHRLDETICLILIPIEERPLRGPVDCPSFDH